MSHDGKRPVTLEDLLRLKRAERPAPEFWEQFDRELRAKQLAALVQKRPWWQELPRVFGGIRRYHLPLGAAAVLAVTFVTVRDFSPAPKPAKVDPSAPVAEIPTAIASEEPSVARPVDVAPVPETRVAATENAGSETLTAAELANATEASAAGSSSRVIPLLVGTLEPASPEDTITPSARYIAANLAAVEATEAAAVRGLLGKARTFDARVATSRPATIEPLQQMTHPSEVRLARYRSPMVVTVAEDAGERTGERVARRISGDRLYEHIGRIGARGDSVSWKF